MFTGKLTVLVSGLSSESAQSSISTFKPPLRMHVDTIHKKGKFKASNCTKIVFCTTVNFVDTKNTSQTTSLTELDFSVYSYFTINTLKIHMNDLLYTSTINVLSAFIS